MSSYTKSSSRLSPSPHKPDLYQELLVKTGQYEKEVKTRKAAEDRYKEVVAKMDRLQLVLQEKSEELDAERNTKQDSDERCQTLQLTIDKLEEYLRKKSSNEYQNIGKNEAAGSTTNISDVITLENSLQETTKKLKREEVTNQQLLSRCKQLEKILSSNGIDIPQGQGVGATGDMSEELDF